MKPPPANGGVMIPPVGMCGVCHKPLSIGADRETVTWQRFVAGRIESAQNGQAHACCPAHAAELLRRLAVALERSARPAPGSPDWARDFGVVVDGAP